MKQFYYCADYISKEIVMILARILWKDYSDGEKTNKPRPKPTYFADLIGPTTAPCLARWVRGL